MQYKNAEMDKNKKIALVAHDNKKQELIDWVNKNLQQLSQHKLFATGTTGALIESELNLPVHKLISGPLGGDQQIGAKITTGEIDVLVFFWDPFEPMPHDPDVKALLRIAAVWNIPIACNLTSADFLISSPLMEERYARSIPDYDQYLASRN
ncbi:methylglyoxal synthase [Zooshikella marina]|uniref:Methylglyoxal synthase n=1 Tax=Zooshikella ganghwensis TaxID=202772 RepID=A0A4P9VIF4_9GAMM|nr:methylglyoxal synthase [Zooshikella ganghwensis]MBU2705528.1 methylglyoxal synthase [Zooshikella ganghwensis]RDH42933.1 methylglyoxal synthase [Zooshikella ganghwensis]